MSEVVNPKTGSYENRFLFVIGDSSQFERAYLTDPGWELIADDSGLSLFWKNEKQLKLCTYCEGDVVIIEASTKEEFDNDLRAYTNWYADHGCPFAVIPFSN